MKMSVRNQTLFSIAHTTCLVLVFKILICSSLPFNDNFGADEEEGSIQPQYLQSILNVDLPSSKVETILYPEHIKKTQPHKRHHHEVESCCPSVKEIVEPLAGKNRSGDLVELYQTEGVKQRFYETSCDPAIVNERCRYLDRKHLASSRCEQQYSYSYALVRDFGTENEVNSGWRMDYIQLRSGCACRIHLP